MELLGQIPYTLYINQHILKKHVSECYSIVCYSIAHK